MVTTAFSRRRFLGGAAVVAGLAVLAPACTNDDDDTGPGADPDLDTAALAAGLEKLAVDTYTETRTAAIQGRFGAAVPQAVVELLTTAASHHQGHLDTWNRVLTAAGRRAVTAPNAQLKPAVEAANVRLADIPGAARLVLRLEDYASQTYMKAIPTLKSPGLIQTASQIVVVDQQHQAVLRYVLGLYPVGSGLGKETSDFAPSDPRPELLTG